MTSTSPAAAPVTTLGIIGAGNIGTTVARLAADAGIDVVLANSRAPETLRDTVADLGPRVRAATAEEAARAGDAVVLTVPLGRVRDVPAEPLAGKVVLDTCNYYPGRDGTHDVLDDHSRTTSQVVAQHLAGASVVKAFNCIYFVALAALARPAGDADRSALPLFSDDADATQLAVRLLDALGYDAVDGGGLADSWRAENGRPVYVTAYAADGDPTVPAPGRAADVRRLLDAAVKDDPEQQPEPTAG